MQPKIVFKRAFFVATMNCRGLNAAGKRIHIDEWGQNFNILPCTTTPLKIERLKTQENYIVEDEIFLLKKGSIVLKDGEGKIVSVLGIVQSKRKKEAILLEASFYDINNNILLLNDVNTKVSFRYLRRMFLMDFKTAFQRLLTLVEIIATGEREFSYNI